VLEELQAAQDEPMVVRIWRASYESESEMGYVTSIGSDLILLLCISTEIRFNGFAVIRIQDISELEAPHAHAEFVEEALRMRGESVEHAPAVDLSDVGAAIRTAGQLFPLVALHRELVDPRVCHIGQVVSVTRDFVSIIEIDPNAEWEKEPSTYSLSDVTRIDFGGGYEDALALVGGTAPSSRHLRPVS
jgi:hypothetical protein